MLAYCSLENLTSHEPPHTQTHTVDSSSSTCHCPDLDPSMDSSSEGEGEGGLIVAGTNFEWDLRKKAEGRNGLGSLRTMLRSCLATTGDTFNKIWCVEITCRCTPQTDLCPLCVRICDQWLTCNPLLNGLTIERHIDLVSLLAKGSRVWHTARVCFVSAGRVVLPWLGLHLSTTGSHTLGCSMFGLLFQFLLQTGFTRHTFLRHLLCYVN